MTKSALMEQFDPTPAMHCDNYYGICLRGGSEPATGKFRGRDDVEVHRGGGNDFIGDVGSG